MLGTLAITIVFLPGVVSFRWAVQHPVGPISAVRGSTVIIPCLFLYPNPGQHFRVLSVMWCRNQSHCITPRYIYHSEGIFPEPRFQGRVEYLGDMVNNCTLKINNLVLSDSGTYVFRFITDHPVEKLPGQMGITLHVTGGDRTALVWMFVGIISVVTLLVVIVGIRKKISAPKDSPAETVALAEPSDHDKHSSAHKLSSSET